MASKTTGYQGFKSFAAQTCPTLKPGETYEQRGTKFSKMGSSIVAPPYQNRVGRFAHESIVMQSGQLVQPSDYKLPDRRGVNGNDGPIVSKPFITPTTYMHDFAPFDTDLKRVLSVPLECYEQAFAAVASANAAQYQQQPVDAQLQTIDLADVHKVLKLVLGEPTPKRVVEIFVSYLDRRRGSQRDRITWDFFCQAIDHIDELFEQELAARGANHGSSNARESNPGSDAAAHLKIPSVTPKSSYLIDIGAYGDKPLDRPYMRKRGMASTTSDLNAGTPHDTNQIPGYAGFLPTALHNYEAISQAHGPEDADSLHPTPRNTLRLFHQDNLPGYSGHKPLSCRNYRGECRAGSDADTTTGDSYRAHK